MIAATTRARRSSAPPAPGCHPPPAAIGGRLADFAALLGQAGVGVVDLTRPMGATSADRYYRTDTHWNEFGAKIAAVAVADALRQVGLAPTQKAEFHVSSEPPRERVGASAASAAAISASTAPG